MASVAVAPDRLRQLVDVLLEAIDERLDGASVARRASLSRFHFDRLVAAGLRESPAAFRRRLLLERAAWLLARGDAVLDTALGAGYGSGEAFARAFRGAFGLAPSAFAGARREFRLPAPNGIHFHPPAGLLFAGPTKRSTAMDLTDRMLEHDLADVRKLLDAAARLDDELLDRVERPGNVVLRFDGREETVREMLDRLVWTKEVWVAAMAGRGCPDRGEPTMGALRERFDRAGPEFCDIVRGIRDDGSWDRVFVDALCEPPQSFSFGGVVAHVLTFSAHRRQVLSAVLGELGVEDVASGDPIDWEHQLAAT